MYLCLNLHLCLFYSIYSLVVLHLDNFVIYISFAGVILPLHLHYIRTCIDIFVNNIIFHSFICLCILYNLIIRCTSYWEFFISLRFMGCSTTASSLHLCFYSYVCEYYIYVCCNICVYFIQSNHWLDSRLGIWKCILLYMICRPLFPYSLTVIHKIVLTHLCFNLPFSCQIHWNTYLCQ